MLVAFWLGYFIFAYVFCLIYGAGDETFGSSLFPFFRSFHGDRVGLISFIKVSPRPYATI